MSAGASPQTTLGARAYSRVPPDLLAGFKAAASRQEGMEGRVKKD